MTPKVETSNPTLTSATFGDLVREMLVRLGEDPEREGLVRTPERVQKAYEFLTRGYSEDPEAMLKNALFTVTYDEMVIVKDVEMFSLCEHHMLPFFGKVHVAYIPNGKVIGLSKIPRLVSRSPPPPFARHSRSIPGTRKRSSRWPRPRGSMRACAHARVAPGPMSSSRWLEAIRQRSMSPRNRPYRSSRWASSVAHGPRIHRARAARQTWRSSVDSRS